jgi:hypothetical protein
VIDKTAARIIKIAAGTGVPTEGISRATGDTGVITEGISNVTGDTRAITARISRLIGDISSTNVKPFRIIGDFGLITKGIFGPIANSGGTTNDIILQGQVTGIGPLPNITAMGIRADLTKGEAVEEITDANVYPGSILIPARRQGRLLKRAGIRPAFNN